MPMAIGFQRFEKHVVISVRTGLKQKIATIFRGPNKIFKDHLLARNYTISQIVQKCTFQVYSNKALRLELFASPASLHFSVHLS